MLNLTYVFVIFAFSHLAIRLGSFRNSIALILSMGFAFLLSPYSLAVIIILFGLTSVLGAKLHPLYMAYFLVAVFLVSQILQDAFPSHITLIGLSFGLFKLYSYHRQTRNVPKKPLFENLLYVLYAPSFIAGPIADPRDFNEAHVSKNAFWFKSTALFSIGVLKVFVFGRTVDSWDLYLQSSSIEPLQVLQLFLKYYYLYFNFSGYTDIVRSISYLWGRNLPENFNNPFIAFTFSDFWNRQHMSLTTWLKENLFLPLSFHFKKRPYLIRLIPMLTLFFVSFWHGISTGIGMFFIIHCLGIYTVDRYGEARLPKWVLWGTTQTLVAISVFLLLSNSTEMTTQFAALASFEISSIMTGLTAFLFLNALMAYLIRSIGVLGRKIQSTSLGQSLISAFLISLVIILIIIYPPASIEFIYSRF